MRPHQERHSLVGRYIVKLEPCLFVVKGPRNISPRFRLFLFLAYPVKSIQRIRRDYQKAVLCPFLWYEEKPQFKLDKIFTRLQIESKTREWSTLTGNVKMTDVFRPHEECENPRVVLVEGNPAMGKTTFCRKLAHDWSLSRIPSDCWFPKVEMLLLLKCRDINEGIANIQDAIDDQLLPVDVERSEKENFFSFIRNYQARILLVLDGLDELKNKDLLLPLIQGKVLSDTYLLLTARPEMGARVRRYCDSLLQIVGYSEGDAISYIDKYFRNHSDPSLAKKLKDELAVNHNLKELTSSPMNTALLCLLCEETDVMFPTKQTELYECFVSCAIRRYFAKKEVGVGEDDPSERYREQLNQLGQIAFEALLKNRLYFSKEEMRSENVLQLWFVTREPSRNKIKPTECYAFTHKTFQEYFAAFYLRNEVLTDSKESEALLLNLSPLDNWQVWKFLFQLVLNPKDCERAVFLFSCLGAAGLRHARPKPRNDITRTMSFKSPRELFSDNFVRHRLFHSPYEGIVENALDLIGEWEDSPWELNDFQKKMAVKLAECIPLEECELNTPTTRLLVTFSEYWKGGSTLKKLDLRLYDENFLNVDIKALAQTLHNNCLLTYLNLNFQRDGDEIAVALSEALESNKTLTHLCFIVDAKPGDPIGESGASALAGALKKNSTLKCLLLGPNSIGDLGAIAFADALQTNSALTQLSLGGNGIGALGIEAICKALQFNHVITHLDLCRNTIGDSGAEALAGALQSPATQLSHLDLEGCEITSLGVESLAGALQTNRSLTHLSLAGLSISCSATALAEAIRLNQTLTHLDLSCSGIRDLGTEAICKALQSNHVTTHLILGGNTIGDSGAEALVEALQSPATQLSYLHLDGCHITSFGVKILAGALETNRSLTHLNLARSRISCSATALAEALQLNRTLTHLDLSYNQMSDTEAIQLAQTLLDKNNTLTYLDLSGNNIGGEEEASSSISCSVTALAEALQLNQTLTHLGLSNNQISDTEAMQLAQTLLDKNNTLAYLGLIGNNIGAEGKAKLELVDGKRCFILF